jgi:hypothetical protein
VGGSQDEGTFLSVTSHSDGVETACGWEEPGGGGTSIALAGMEAWCMWVGTWDEDIRRHSFACGGWECLCQSQDMRHQTPQHSVRGSRVSV